MTHTETINHILEVLANDEEDCNAVETPDDALVFLYETAVGLKLDYFEEEFDPEMAHREATRLAAVSIRLMEICNNLENKEALNP